MSVGEKTLAVLRLASMPISDERFEAHRQASTRWSSKAVAKKFEDLADKGWIEYGVGPVYGWLTTEGRLALQLAEADNEDAS